MHKQKVIYIAGSGHSGSTLLDLIIGSHSKVESVGEIKPQRISRLVQPLSEDHLCSCGSKVAECDYWQSIVQDMSAQGFPDPLQYASGDPVIIDAFIASVLRTAGAAVYGESTKNWRRLSELKSNPSLDVRTIHLVRDPRAVAFSHKRKKGKSLLKRIRAKHWFWLPFASSRADGALTVRYEDMVTDTAQVIGRVMTFTDERFEPSQLNFRSNIHHNLSGNRMRYGESSKIVPDTQYIDQTGRFTWLVMTIGALPTLLRFGYPLTRRGARRMLTPVRPANEQVAIPATPSPAVRQ